VNEQLEFHGVTVDLAAIFAASTTDGL
jgi:hypothetical protein